MKDISQLDNDLRKWIDKGEEIAKKEIAKSALKKSSTNAPVDTGFLSDQGYAFVDGQMIKKSGTSEKGHRRTALMPKGGYDEGVTIVYRAGRPRENSSPFDYAYYIGVYNPAHIKNAVNRKWIESALSPENFQQEIKIALTKALSHV